MGMEMNVGWVRVDPIHGTATIPDQGVPHARTIRDLGAHTDRL